MNPQTLFCFQMDQLLWVADHLDLQVFGETWLSGFRHIFPDGWDHFAFLLGLFFLSHSLPALLLQTTLFTLAHSLTLGLVVFLGLSLPSQAVEIAVGVSIAWLGLEGLFPNRRLSRWRNATIVLFGGVHGLAFAHNFVQFDSLRRSLLSALFGFNLGVETGQLVVIGLLSLLFCPWWERPWYRRRIALPALGSIALAGCAWTLARL